MKKYLVLSNSFVSMLSAAAKPYNLPAGILMFLDEAKSQAGNNLSASC